MPTLISPPISNIFAREEHVYEQHKQELLQSAEGQFVLIKQESIIGIFPTLLAAVEKGTELYINQLFYTRQITAFEPVIVAPSNFTVLPN